ncbi:MULTISPECIES: phosphodiesterase [unclassified Sinorhizobium]|uniref:phosphodiesterase n=1 Tax=unclassified Sinorhizobium TaxID=2613772 RepID=UPI0035239E96
MQKIIHLTDPHIVAPGRTLYGMDPAQRLRETLAHISRAHPDAVAIVITGDLADTGDPAAYRLLRDILADVRLPVHLTIGNHDRRAAFRDVFGGEGFVQSAIDIDQWRILLLDTNDETSDSGCLDGGRIEWLDAQLADAADRPVLLAMHHTPSNLHAPFFAPEDDMIEPERFLDIVSKHKAVRHMLFGHRHLTAAGSFAGIPFTASRGTAHHIALDFGQRGRSDLVAAPPSYEVVFLEDASVVVHCHHGLETQPLVRPGDPK